MSAALTFLAAKLRALWHEQRGHTIFTSRSGRGDRISEIYCQECRLVLWVRP